MNSRDTEQPRPRLIVGMGATGLSVARYFARRGIPFGITDSRNIAPGTEALTALGTAPRRIGAFASPLPLDRIAEAVVSPGISLQEPFLQKLKNAGIPLVGDIELFARALEQAPNHELQSPKLVAITGSNGKSTVTALVADMARGTGRRVAVGGNFGIPVLDLLGHDADLYVLELSSFQLELAESLAPTAAVVLNVSADHIDRHGSMERYADFKARIYRRAGTAVVNAEDPRVAAMDTGDATRVTFGSATGEWHLQEADGEVWLCHGDRRLIAAGELALSGEHNRLNALAALALGTAVDIPEETMFASLRRFRGLSHRCQFIAETAGVTWIDDSKGTNVGAVLASLNSLDGPIVWLAGGQAKDGDFTALAPLLARKGRAAVLFGTDAERIASAVGDAVPVERVPDLRAAVAAAVRIAQPGDTVLLSPGCASLDQFRDYRDRGEQFTALVRELVPC